MGGVTQAQLEAAHPHKNGPESAILVLTRAVRGFVVFFFFFFFAVMVFEIKA
jgi:hypothetical protein